MGRTSDARERLIESGGSLMHQRGYTAVGVSEVCAHAGVNKGSFYYFFPSKQELAKAVIDDYWQQYSSLLDALVSGEGSALQRIRSFFEMSYQSQLESKESCGSVLGCPFGNFALEMSTQDEVIREEVRRHFDRYASQFEAVLNEAIDAGDLPAQDAAKSARSILALLQGGLMMAKMNNDPEALHDLIDQAMLLVRAS